MNFELNTNDAREGDSAKGGWINKTGGYTGKFTMAMLTESSKGTKGVEFTFESDIGQSANYLTIWIENNKGVKLPGFKHMNALMMVAGVRVLTATKTVAKVYDFDQKKVIDKEVIAYPEIINIPIGVVLQRELYTKNNGTDGDRMNIYTFFESSTGRSASERIDSANAEAIATLVERLEDKDSRGQNGGATSPATTSSSAATAAVDFDDDIPF